jgi:hypothetical protein
MSEYKPMNNQSLLDTVTNILMNDCVCGDTSALRDLLLYVPAHELLTFVRDGTWNGPQTHNGIPAMELLDDDDYAKGEPTYDKHTR